MPESHCPNSLLSTSIKILVICEGGEDYLYINHLISLNVFNPHLQICALDARGSSRIYEAYKKSVSSGEYDLVFIYCDTELSPYSDYKNNKRKINYLYYKRDVFSDITFFANPVTMQIMILHKTDILIPSNKKADYQTIVNDYYGIINYDASGEQVKLLISQIDVNSYQDMKRRILNYSSDDYRISNSTNFLKLLDYLEDGNITWAEPLIKEAKVVINLNSKNG